MKKEWVIIQYTKHKDNLGREGKIVAWRDYGDDYVWGSAIYEVIGYHTGSYKEALDIGERL